MNANTPAATFTDTTSTGQRWELTGTERIPAAAAKWMGQSTPEAVQAASILRGLGWRVEVATSGPGSSEIRNAQ